MSRGLGDVYKRQGVTNALAEELGGDLQAASPFYGVAPALDGVPKIKAKIVAHYAEDDPRVNATRPPYEAALKAASIAYEMYTYPGTKHGFHNNSTPRYNEAAAKLAWERTIALFKEKLA